MGNATARTRALTGNSPLLLQSAPNTPFRLPGFDLERAVAVAVTEVRQEESEPGRASSVLADVRELVGEQREAVSGAGTARAGAQVDAVAAGDGGKPPRQVPGHVAVVEHRIIEVLPGDARAQGGFLIPGQPPVRRTPHVTLRGTIDRLRPAAGLPGREPDAGAIS